MSLIAVQGFLGSLFPTAGFASAGATPIVGPVAYAGTSVVSAVQTWWPATLPLPALFAPGKLWYKSAPENAQTLPYATIFRVSQVIDSQTTAYSLMRTVVQVNLHAATAYQAETLGTALRTALRVDTPLFVNSIQVDHVLPDGDSLEEGEGLGTNGMDCWIDMEMFEVMWTRSRNS